MKSLLAAALVTVALAVPACSSPDGGSKTCSYTYRNPNREGTVTAAADRAACTFTGSLIKGGTYDSAAYKGKVLVVSFWASWCGPCQVEMPQYDLMFQKDKAQGVSFVGVATKDDKERSEAWLARNKISFPIVTDEPGEVALQMGNLPAQALPFTVVIDKQARVAAVYNTPQSAKDLQPVLDKLAAER
jgi:peroxiredoxin